MTKVPSFNIPKVKIKDIDSDIEDRNDEVSFEVDPPRHAP